MKTEQEKQLQIVVDEWEQVGTGQKTVPLIQTNSNSSEIEKERKIFAFAAKTIKKLLSK